MASYNSSFQTDPDFCPECGTILPLPGLEKTVTCLACQFKVDVKTFDQLSTDYEIKFNNRSKFKKLKDKDNRKSADGPMAADRICSKCGNEGMTYATLQTRSADEGQTVFYSCTKCKHQELENS